VPAIEAVGEVPAAREEVFAFLASLPNHWGPGQPLDRGDRPAGGGAARWKRTQWRGDPDPWPARAASHRTHRGARRRAPGEDLGTGRAPGRDRRDRHLVPRGGEPGDEGAPGGLETSSPLDRLLLALGGRTWLRRHFATVLETLAAQFEPERPARA
jgi:hypothetical protein